LVNECNKNKRVTNTVIGKEESCEREREERKNKHVKARLRWNSMGNGSLMWHILGKKLSLSY
jgi:hypothetical protein